MNNQEKWYENANFYHVYPLGVFGTPRENNENNPKVEPIDQLKDWIPYWKELGVNSIYFGPLWESSTHGYDTKDDRKLDKRLGTNEDLKELCATLKKEGMHIIFDGVFHHVGREFFAFLDVKKNRENSIYKDWFCGIWFEGNNSYQDGFSYECWRGCEELVKLNLSNPQVRDYLFESIAFWMEEFQIDGLRLDAADSIQKDFFEHLHQFVKAKREDFWLMGEVIHGNYCEWVTPDRLDSVTNYECWKGIYSSHNDKNYFEIAHSLQRQFSRGGIYEGMKLYNFVDNHDVNRIATLLKDKNHLPLVYTLMYTMPGVPSIYYGSEVGILGEKSKEDGDWPLRPKLDWKELEKEEEKLRNHIRVLADYREKHIALREGGFENITITNQQLLFARTHEKETIYVALNLSADVAVIRDREGNEIQLQGYESKIIEK